MNVNDSKSMHFSGDSTAGAATGVFQQMTGWFPGFAILVLGISILTTTCADPDLWGHIQYGREVLRDGVLPETATWTFAAEGAPWVNHENIAELMFAWSFDTFGNPGLIGLKLVLAITLLVLMMISVKTAKASWIAVAVVGVVELGDGPGGGGGGGAGGGGEGEGGGAERGGDGGHEGAGLVEPSRFGAASGSVEVQCGSGGLGHCVPCRGWLVANVWTPGSVTRGILADRADPVRDRPDAWSVNRPWRPVSGSPVWFSR